MQQVPCTRALWAAIRPAACKWHRQTGRSSRTWLRTVELDVGLRRCNIGLHSAWQRAQDSCARCHAEWRRQDRRQWQNVVETAIRSLNWRALYHGDGWGQNKCKKNCCFITMCKAHSKVTHIKQQIYFYHLKRPEYNTEFLLYPRPFRW